MEMFLIIVFLLSALAVVPAFVASLYCSYAFNRYLRHAHPDVWAKIAPASPRAQPSLSARNVRFITQRTYRSVPDARLGLLGDRCFRLLYIAASVFLVLILSGLASSALSQAA